MNDTDFLQNNTKEHKLVITAQDGTPIEPFGSGKIVQREDI